MTSFGTFSSTFTSSWTSSLTLAFDLESWRRIQLLKLLQTDLFEFTFFELDSRHDKINCCEATMLIRVNPLFFSKVRQADGCRGDTWRGEKIPIWDKQPQNWKPNWGSHHQTILAILSKQLILSLCAPEGLLWQCRCIRRSNHYTIKKFCIL